MSVSTSTNAAQYFDYMLHLLPFDVMAHVCGWLDGLSMRNFRQLAIAYSAHRTSSHSLPDICVMHLRMVTHIDLCHAGRVTLHLRSFMGLYDTDGFIVDHRCCDLMRISCGIGDLDTLNLLSSAPFWSGQLTPTEALIYAFRHKHMAIFDRLVEPPFSMQACDNANAAMFFRQTVEIDDAVLLNRLTIPPFGVGHAMVRTQLPHSYWWRHMCSPIELVCHLGAVRVLGRMAEPPFCISNDEIRAHNNRIMRAIGHSGHANILKRLAEPPFQFDASDARTLDNEIMRHAARYGYVEIFNVLANVPYSMGTEDARVCDGCIFKDAAENGHVNILIRLAQQPYCLNMSDAQSDNNAALRLAVENGHIHVLDCLSTWPYLLAQQDARNCDALYVAVVNRHAQMVDRLARAPFLIDQTDVRHSNKDILHIAFRDNCVDILDRLALHPFNLNWRDAHDVITNYMSLFPPIQSMQRFDRPPYQLPCGKSHWSNICGERYRVNLSDKDWIVD